MNIALGAVTIFFLFIFPALVMRKGYYSHEFSKQYFISNQFEVLATSLIPGFLIQAFHYGLAYGLAYLLSEPEWYVEA